MELIEKYRWYLIGTMVLDAAIPVWSSFMTDSPQAVPFEYQVS